MLFDIRNFQEYIAQTVFTINKAKAIILFSGMDPAQNNLRSVIHSCVQANLSGPQNDGEVARFSHELLTASVVRTYSILFIESPPPGVMFNTVAMGLEFPSPFPSHSHTNPVGIPMGILLRFPWGFIWGFLQEFLWGFQW